MASTVLRAIGYLWLAAQVTVMANWLVVFWYDDFRLGARELANPLAHARWYVWTAILAAPAVALLFWAEKLDARAKNTSVACE